MKGGGKGKTSQYKTQQILLDILNLELCLTFQLSRQGIDLINSSVINFIALIFEHVLLAVQIGIYMSTGA